MSVCGFGYASGFRFRSGQATVTVDGRVLRVFRDGEGSSSDDCYAGTAQPDAAVGRISFSELSRRLGGTECVLTVRADTGEPLVDLPFDPSRAMGRQGRVSLRSQGTAATQMWGVFQSLDAVQQRNLAALQLDTLPDTFRSSRASTMHRVTVVLPAIMPDAELRAKLISHPTAPAVIPIRSLLAKDAALLASDAVMLPPGRNRRIFSALAHVHNGHFDQQNFDLLRYEALAAIGAWAAASGDTSWMSPSEIRSNPTVNAVVAQLRRGATSLAEVAAGGPQAAIDAASRPAWSTGFPLVVNPPDVAALAERSPVFGVEWTKDASALDGNIDPQHGRTASKSAPAAVQEAFSAPLPTPGSTLVTVRPDLDAYGAAAILNERFARSDAAVASAAVRERAGRIAAADVRADLAARSWMPRVYDPSHIDDPELHVVSAAACGRGVPPDQGVRVCRDWLMEGTLPSNAEEILSSTIASRRQALDDVAARGGVQTIAAGAIPVAVVTSTAFAALDIGYASAPLVVATNPEFRPPGSESAVVKRTIALHPSASGDLRDGLVQVLDEAEVAAGGSAGWGGQGKILGSPQGKDSVIPADVLSSIVANWAQAKVTLG